MDNGALIFIIIIEAIVIIWQASKLKQYQKIESLFSYGVTPAAAPNPSPNATANAQQTSIATLDDKDLLEGGSVDPEANIEEAKRVQLVMARCRYAEFYLEQLDDDYEHHQFSRIVDSCKDTALKIQDPFFRASALHPLIVLLDKAEWHDLRDQLLAGVDDNLVRQRINDELSEASELTS